MILRTVLRRTLRVIALVVAFIVVLSGLLAGAYRVQFTGAPASWAKSTGNDALWLGHGWVDGRKNEQDVEALATRLKATGIKDLYVHTGPFAKNGAVQDRYPMAPHFVRWMHRYAPGVRVQAWLGQKVDGYLDLEDQQVRARIVRSITEVVLDLGFDGVHYNFEPIGSGDENFLDLLAKTRAVLPPTAKLSTSTPQIEPYSAMRPIARALVSHDKYWSPEYFRRVAAQVDQVAIMTYDSFMPTGSLYGGHVARQAELALDLVPEDRLVLIGAPAYHDHGVFFLDAAESVAAAAEGARLAVTENGARKNFGLALYVDFAATDQDWNEYERYWMR